MGIELAELGRGSGEADGQEGPLPGLLPRLSAS